MTAELHTGQMTSWAVCPKVLSSSTLGRTSLGPIEAASQSRAASKELAAAKSEEGPEGPPQVCGGSRPCEVSEETGR